MDVNFNSVEMMEDAQPNSEVDELMEQLGLEIAGIVPAPIS